MSQDGCDPDGRELQDLPVHLEGTTKSYMERMEELVATRLAISDTEGKASCLCRRLTRASNCDESCG